MIPLAEDRTVSEAKNKPVQDEQALAKLLEAAYVLQEHNREMRLLQSRIDFRGDTQETHTPNSSAKNIPSPTRPTTPLLADNTSTLAKIVETQHQIQARRLDFVSALKLVAERVSEMTKAAGAAIGIIEGTSVRYCAVAGYSTPTRDSLVPLDKSMLGPSLKTGVAFRCADTSTEAPLDPDTCKSRGIQSLIAVPVYHDGEIAGGLEVYYASPNVFAEQEVHTCQLMAGLVAEALAREEEANWKKSLAIERAAMLEALEKLQPNLAALVEKPLAKNAASEAQPGTVSYSCRKCGHQLTADEQFCGQCGSPRAGDYDSNTQSKVASLWHMQESQKKDAAPGSGKSEPSKVTEKPDAVRPELSIARSLEQQIPELFDSGDLEVADNDELVEMRNPVIEEEISHIEGEEIAPAEEASDETPDSSKALTKTQATHPAVWGSAASARAFLEQLASSKRAGKLLQFWNRHRGDIYLGVAVILVLCVLRWGLWSDHSVKATASPTKASATHRKPAQDPGLSFFDRMLIELGLAEAPDPPPDRGNPAVQVWVDLHTALYYCAGSDFYGKTPQGKFTTQREAQLDQFQPAYRKVCN